MIPANTILHGRYRIVQRLALGGMGAIYQAIDENLNCVVAVKETFALSKEYLKAFKREAELLANLNHPVIPKVTDHFVEGDGQFLIMEFIPGHDLADLMEIRERPFAVNRVLEWADNLLDALEDLHSHKPPVIHRDIKPSNLKLTPKGRIMLLDFGLAKGSAGQMSTLNSGETGYSIHGYTKHYAPPEQIKNTGTDHRSDLYSLGATLWSLMTGKLPPDALFRAAEKQTSGRDPLQDDHALTPDVPQSVARVIYRAMSLNRSHRPASAAAMRQMLQEAIEENQRVQSEIETRPRHRTSRLQSGESLAGHPITQTAKPAVHRSERVSDVRRRRSDIDTVAKLNSSRLNRSDTPAQEGGDATPPPTVAPDGKLSAAASANSFAVRTMPVRPDVLYSKDDLAIFDVAPSGPLPAGFAIENLKPQAALKAQIDEALSRGNQARDLKDYDRAEQEYRRALMLDPADARVYYALGNVFYDQHRFADAIHAYKESLRIKPDDAVACKNLGIAYEAEQRYTDAIEQYQKAITLDPGYAHAYYNLGQVYTRQRRYSEAVAQFRKAIAIHPQYERAHNGLGNVYYAQKQYLDAIDHFQRAIEVNPDYVHAYSNLGNAYYALQRYSEAIDKYQRAIQLNPRGAHPYANLGNVYFNQKRYDDAIGLYEKAIELDPRKSNVAYLLSNIGRAYYAQGNYSRALAQYKKATELDPKQSLAYYSLGLTYLVLRNKQAAMEQYQMLQKLKSSYAEKLLREMAKLQD